MEWVSYGQWEGIRYILMVLGKAQDEVTPSNFLAVFWELIWKLSMGEYAKLLCCQPVSLSYIIAEPKPQC